MNEYTCLLNKDIDSLIFSNLDPPSVLAMSEVNKHAESLLRAQRLLINEIAYDFMKACSWGCLEMAQWIRDVRYVDIHDKKDRIFQLTCRGGHLCVAQWLIAIGEETNSKIDIHAGSENAFVLSCAKGHQSLAEWLIRLGEGSYGLIDIHKVNEEPFRRACSKGQVDIAKWLVKIGSKSYGKIRIHAVHDAPFRDACKYRHREIADWLIALGKESASPIPEKLIEKHYK